MPHRSGSRITSDRRRLDCRFVTRWRHQQGVLRAMVKGVVLISRISHIIHRIQKLRPKQKRVRTFFYERHRFYVMRRNSQSIRGMTWTNAIHQPTNLHDFITGTGKWHDLCSLPTMIRMEYEGKDSWLGLLRMAGKEILDLTPHDQCFVHSPACKV